MKKLIYRGYDLIQTHDNQWVISINGVDVSWSTSEENAMKWVNEEKKRLSRERKA